MSGYTASGHIGRPQVRAVIAPVADRVRPTPTDRDSIELTARPAAAWHASLPASLPTWGAGDATASLEAGAAVTAVAVDLVEPEPSRLARVRREVVLGWRQTTFFLFSADGWR